MKLIKLIILLIIINYILKSLSFKKNIKDFYLLLFLIIILLTKKKETFIDYPCDLEEDSIDVTKYENINKELIQKKRVYTPNGYHKNKEMYSLDHEDVNCHPLEIPTTFYNKN